MADKWEYSQVNHRIDGPLYDDPLYFEYKENATGTKIKEVDLWKFMAKLGLKGWEMVSYSRTNYQTQSGAAECWIFKRLIID